MILDELAMQIIENKIQEGDKIRIDADSEAKIKIKVETKNKSK